MKKPFLNYLLIAAGIVLLVINIYENNGSVDRTNIFRIIGAVCIIVLGIYNLYLIRKK